MAQRLLLTTDQLLEKLEREERLAVRNVRVAFHSVLLDGLDNPELPDADRDHVLAVLSRLNRQLGRRREEPKEEIRRKVRERVRLHRQRKRQSQTS